MRHRISHSLAAIASVAVAAAQTPARFEVASIKPNKANDRIVTINVGPGGRFAARGYSLQLLIQRAYGVMGWNIAGGPEWVRDDRYDVIAKAAVPGDLTEQQLRPLLQDLLADRFKLKLREESREMAGYALKVASGGLKATPSADGVEHPDSFRMDQSKLTGQGITMEDFARYVTGKLGLVGVDQTGLKGLYDFKADWVIEKVTDTGGLPITDPREEWRSAAFGAIQDQLGLKLNPQKIPVRVLVIDSVERPSEN